MLRLPFTSMSLSWVAPVGIRFLMTHSKPVLLQLPQQGFVDE